MKFYGLSLTGDTDDSSLAFVDDEPEELGSRDYYMRRGKPIGKLYPPDVKVHLSKESPGIKLASLLGCSLSYLMVNTQAKDLILGHSKCEIEALPFTLINHKGRVHSKDYWIMNPVGTFDCVNRDASDIQYEDETKQEVVGISWAPGSLVFDSKKMQRAADLFRIPEEPALMFVSQSLVRAMNDAQLTNILLTEDMRIEPVK